MAQDNSSSSVAQRCQKAGHPWKGGVPGHESGWVCERTERAPADLEAIVVCAVLRAVRNQTDAKASSLRGWEGGVAINRDRKNQEGVLLWSIKIIFF